MAQFSNASLATASLAELRQILLDLLCTKAYKEGDFTLSSGQKSSYYINGKLVTLDPIGAIALGRLLLHELAPATAAVAGLTLGADPMVSAISMMSAYGDAPIPGLIIRKEAKGHGTQVYIEGPLPPVGSTIAVIEDVVTTGQSALQAVTRLQEAGYSVTQVLALVDREQGGAALYQSVGLDFKALFAIPDLQQRWQTLQS
jgi:orotate phosphoribosyltransferase